MATNDRGVTQHPRRNCYFCGSEGPIETHHIVPQRRGGSDDECNLVDLCPTCHERLERLYDERFYGRVNDAEIDPEGADNTQNEDTPDVDPEVKVAILRKIEFIADSYPEGAPIEKLYLNNDEWDNIPQDKEEIDRVVDELRSYGEIYEPKKGNLRTV